MATIEVTKLNIGGLKGLNSVNRRIERTALAFDQSRAVVSKPSQLLAAMPGNLLSNRIYLAEVDSRVGGFAMVRQRADEYRWDVLVLGAGTRMLDPSDDLAIELWKSLLDRVIDDGASIGVRRVFSQAREHSVVFQSFRQVGFEGFSRQSILSGIPQYPVSPPDGFRRMHPSDVWSVHQLYHRSTPPVVQYAEAATSEDWQAPRYALRARLKLQFMTTHQFVVDAAQGVCAFCRVSSGSRFTIVYFLIADSAKQYLYDFVRSALDASGIAHKQVIRVAVPGYQYDCLDSFLAAGFKIQREQINMVKHTTVPLVVHPKLQPIPGIDRTTQPASGITIAGNRNGKFASIRTARRHE